MRSFDCTFSSVVTYSRWPAVARPVITASFFSLTISFQRSRAGSFRSTAKTRPFGASQLVRRNSVSPAILAVKTAGTSLTSVFSGPPDCRSW
jgi:hypothetical protein